MLSPSIEIQIIATVVAMACSTLGVFLVLRKMSMMCDSITHTVLLGIVFAFFVTKDLSSPLLLIGATLIGVVTVWLTELLKNTRLLGNDAAIGVVFPLLFSIAIILISVYAGNVHLDTRCVLLGELAYAPFDRTMFLGMNLPSSLVTMGFLLVLNLLFVIIFYKELKLSTFDGMLAASMGFMPVLLHYLLMTLVSLTTVGAFEAVGSILVIAFMVGPPCAAYLLTKKLHLMIIYSCIIGGASGVLGYKLAQLLDASISGCMAMVIGIIFFVILILSPRNGIISTLVYRKKQRFTFAKTAMLIHILKRQNKVEGTPIQVEQLHLNWKASYIDKIKQQLEAEKQIVIQQDGVVLTADGAAHATEYLQQLGLN